MATECSVVDLGAVTYLLALAHKQTALRPTGRNGQCSFIFTQTETEVQDAITNYFSGASVPAKLYWEYAKSAKSLLYGVKPCYHKDSQGGVK
jgi:hypothetical protein